MDGELLTFVGALGGVAILMPPMIHHLTKSQKFDIPNDRSMHSSPIPRGGGLILALVAPLVALVNSWDLNVLTTICASILLAAVGFRDDHGGIAPRIRLLLQFAVGACASLALIQDMTGHLWWILIFYTGSTCWFAAFVNAFNFMDGINGISSFQCIAAGFSFALMGHEWGSSTLQTLGFIIAGAAVGFLPFNFPKARVYLGDVGSYFCGAWLASMLVIAIRSQVPFEIAVSPIALYLADTSVTIVRRIYQRQSLTTAHKSHAFQLIAQHTDSHAASSLLAACAIALTFTITFSLRNFSLDFRIVGTVLALLIVATYLALPAILKRMGQVRVL